MAEKKAPKAATCRMFETPFIEWFSRIHPVTPFLFWVPVLALMSWWSLRADLAGGWFAALVVAGWLAWSLAEYLLHRYVFHYIGPQSWKRRFHFIFHGVHHDYPQDAHRLVFPLGVSITIGLVFYLAMNAAVGQLYASALFVGFGGGYLLYDGIHYFTHHLKARSRMGKFLKRYHMVHHHTGVEGMWGVSQPFWDYLLGSQRDLRQRRPPVATS